MAIFYEDENDIRLPINGSDLSEKVVSEAIEYTDFPYESEVSILLTNNSEIRRLNREFRGLDKATDVLSFPLIDYPSPGVFDFLEDESSCFNPETGEAMLGDIVISKEKVLEQAQEYGHSVEREFAFLIAHSMLHLFGYDHMVEEERLVMEAKQKAILERLQILR